ncbi:MAG: hypothetical protein ABW352_17580 [Polyangiales bacterium]
MTLAHYDALTARAFDRHDTTNDADEPSAHETHDAESPEATARHHEQMSRIAAAVGGALLHLGVPCLGAIAWWLNT